MEQIIDEHVDLALSKQSSHQEGPTNEMIPTAKGESSVSSTEHAPTATKAATTPAFEARNLDSPENRPHWFEETRSFLMFEETRSLWWLFTVRSASELLDV
jgi:hypothetical protein